MHKCNSHQSMVLWWIISTGLIGITACGKTEFSSAGGPRTESKNSLPAIPGVDPTATGPAGVDPTSTAPVMTTPGTGDATADTTGLPKAGQPGGTDNANNGAGPTGGTKPGDQPGGATPGSGDQPGGATPGSGGRGDQITVPTGAGGTLTALRSCSQKYSVPGTANPYLAGVADGTALTYLLGTNDPQTPTDAAPAASPLLVTPIGKCITAGNSLYFTVSGDISFSQTAPKTDANGSLNTILSHQKGAQLGKSNITAPLNSLLGVFLASGDPTLAPAPAALNFSTQAARDYTSLAPLVGQVFFIGTGKTSGGAYHQIIVPQGATRLYFAVMDTYQWNNNLGTLSGEVLTAAP